MRYFEYEQDMKKPTTFFILLAFLIGEGVPLFANAGNFPGFQKKTAEGRRETKGPGIGSVFTDVEAGLTGGDLSSITKHFAKQVYISLRGTEDGCYSSNQAYYIIQNYFNQGRITNFKFTKKSETGPAPYATGGGTFRSRGERETIQVYVALTRLDGAWVITQFNVY